MTPPNILFILVDEMRYPMHFPPGISNADQFLEKFMPHTHRLLWSPGVRFHNAYTTASDCTPARGTIVTGLYAQQTFCLTTRANVNEPQSGFAPQPQLNPAFPTYGKILREAGYDTPYIGKWHLSNFPENPNDSYLEEYGFDGLTNPDPVSLPGQGYGATPAGDGHPMPLGDPQLANQAVSWLQQRAGSEEKDKPFCLTVGFSNPHDKQYFWGGIEVSRFNSFYANAGADPTLHFTTNIVHQMDPPSNYVTTPENWVQTDRLQMSLHKVFREYFAGAVGDSSQFIDDTFFKMRDSFNPAAPPVVVAPYGYWAKGLNMYVQAMHDVDEHIAQVIENIPESLSSNTVIVFASDHGEYAASHGLQGKGFTAYEETMRVPLIFTDLTGRYGSSNQDRSQYASSVDLLPLFANLAYGNNSWSQSDDLRGLYDSRNDLLSVIQTNGAVIRDYAAFSCDEVLAGTDNYLNAPQHVLAFTDSQGKTGIYSHWAEGQAQPLASGQELEYYDYAKDRLELDNEPAKGTSATSRLLNDILPNEIQRSMPTQVLRDAQQAALELYWKYVQLANGDPVTDRLARML